MDIMQKELSKHGVDVTFVAINTAGAEVDQSVLSNQGDFPTLQDTEEVKIWEAMGATKDDFYLYGSDGLLVAHLPIAATVNTNLTETAGYENLRAMAAALE